MDKDTFGCFQFATKNYGFSVARAAPREQRVFAAQASFGEASAIDH
jgi:hypothetical protein